MRNYFTNRIASNCMKDTLYSKFYNTKQNENGTIDIHLNNKNKNIIKDHIFENMELKSIPGDYEEYVLDTEPELYPEMNFRDLVSKSDIPNTTYASHSISSHPATFIPHIPSYIIKSLNHRDNDLKILDPFNGQGTTAIESLINGCDYTGVEINPVSLIMSEVATTVIPPENITELIKLSKNKLENLSLEENEQSIEFPGRTNQNHWFEKDAIDDLRLIRKLITEINFEELITEDIKDHVKPDDFKKLLTLGLMNTVFEVSNADPGVSKAHKSKKMRKKIKNNEHPPDGIPTFISELEKIYDGLESLWTIMLEKHKNKEDIYNNLPTISINLSDSREFTYNKEERKANLVITSPPYINAINYYRGSKLRLFWTMDILESFYDFNAENLRRQFIGTNSVSIKNISDKEFPKTMESVWNSEDSFEETRLKHLDQNISDIYNLDQKTSKKKSYVTWKFFAEDMALTLERIYHNIDEGGYVFFVVGENTIGSQLIPTHKYIEDIASNLGKLSTTSLDDSEGFNIVGTAFDKITNRGLFKTRNHNGGIIECEWIVIMQK